MKLEEIKQEYFNKFCWVGCGNKHEFKRTSNPLDVFNWITNKLKSTKRSTKANRLYWLWMRCLEDETGEKAKEYHKYFKQKFIGAKIEKGLNNLDIVIEPSTANMLSKPFNDYMKKVQAEAATEFKTILPLPEDLGYDQFLEHYKDYL